MQRLNCPHVDGHAQVVRVSRFRARTSSTAGMRLSALNHLLLKVGLSRRSRSAQVEKALQAGGPALLAALTSLVSKPGGAAALMAAVTQQQPGVLTSLANMIGGSGQKALIDTGVSTLTSILGARPRLRSPTQSVSMPVSAKEARRASWVCLDRS